MRVPERCQCGGRCLVYATIQHERYTVRYRRCSCCHETSKSIQMKSFLSSKPIVELVPFDATMPLYRTTNTTNKEQGR